MTVFDELVPPSTTNQRLFTANWLECAAGCLLVSYRTLACPSFQAHELHGWRSGVLRDLLFDVDQQRNKKLRRISARLRVS